MWLKVGGRARCSVTSRDRGWSMYDSRATNREMQSVHVRWYRAMFIVSLKLTRHLPVFNVAIGIIGQHDVVRVSLVHVLAASLPLQLVLFSASHAFNYL